MFRMRDRAVFVTDEDEENLYSKKSRESLVEEGVLDSEEDAFMQGYEDGIQEQLEEEEEPLWVE